MVVAMKTVTLVASLIREDNQLQRDQTSSQATHRFPQPLTTLPHLLLHRLTARATPQWSNRMPVRPTHLNTCPTPARAKSSQPTQCEHLQPASAVR